MKVKYSNLNSRFISLLSICLIITIADFAQDKINTKATTFPIASPYSHIKFTYKIIIVEKNTFGYDIYSNENLLIHQYNIPGFQGNQGFKTKTKARKVAKLVIKKIESGEMPPTIHIEELKEMNIIQ